MMNLLSFFAAATCEQTSFKILPTWYQYLVAAGRMQVDNRTDRCEFVGTIQFMDLALIGLGVVDILLRVAGLVTVGYVIYGGIQYVLSQGEPDKAKKARGTIINALIGLGFVLVATGVVAFIGNRLG